MGDASIKGRSPLLKGGRVGLRQGGGLPYLTRGWSRPGVHKTPRGKQHMAEIIKQGPKVVKGKANPLRMDQAQRLKTHRTRQRLLKTKEARIQEGKSKAFHEKHIKPASPATKVKISKQIAPKSWRRAGKS